MVEDDEDDSEDDDDDDKEEDDAEGRCSKKNVILALKYSKYILLSKSVHIYIYIYICILMNVVAVNWCLWKKINE